MTWKPGWEKLAGYFRADKLKDHKILLIGADGQLGTDLQKVIPPGQIIPLTISEIDITNKEQTLNVIGKYHPEVVINTAAYHQVDACEDNDELAFKVNMLGVKNVCLACLQNNSTLVQISTDYVFDGNKRKPYTEDDRPNPQGVYGITKLAGEYYVKYMLSKYFIVRSSGLYGAAGCMASNRLNFIELMLKLAKEKGKVRVVTDQIVSPTYTLDLASKIYQLCGTGKYGLYHITNNGQCSWYDFAKKAFELAKTKVILEKTTSAEFASKAKRPAYSVLENRNLRKIKMDDLRAWDQALAAYLKEKGHIK